MLFKVAFINISGLIIDNQDGSMAI